MKRITLMPIIVIVCFIVINMAGCATSADIEKILREQRWNELDAAVKSYVEYNIKTEYKVEIESNIKWTAAFLKQYEICDHTKQPANIDATERCSQEALDIWNKMASNRHIFPRPFIDDLNSKKDQVVATLNEIRQKKSDEEKLRREKESYLAIQRQKERAWEQEGDNLLRETNDKAFESAEYKGSPCNICGYTAEKKHLEKAIKEEQSYSDKYGVVNLSKLDKYKQAIIQIDQISTESKKEYKKHSGKNYDMVQCKNIKVESCGDELDKLQKNITSRLVSEQLNQMQDQDKKNFLLKYLSAKQASD